ncbi:MAG: prolipoprotein diacylglyceryl transferase [Treponema sp.]|nr:prolipoprotein diacylglyceryl transferase [Treponema sp.]
MILCGIFSSVIYASIMAQKRRTRNADIIMLALYMSIGVIIGGVFLFALVNIANNKNIILANIVNINEIGFIPVFISVFGGTIFYGGLIGGLIMCFICVRKNCAYSNYIDIIAVSIPLFHFWGRIGCFLGGCCFGIESSFGFTFQRSLVEEANEMNRFPVQLLEALFNISLFFLLNYYLQNNKFKNRLVYMYLLIYPTGRFFIEFLRGDEHRGIWIFLSTSQIISIALFLYALVGLYISHRKI